MRWADKGGLGGAGNGLGLTVDNCGFAFFSFRTATMANKIRTEADRKATPPLPGARRVQGGGERLSQERGSHTRSKKNPGKRPGKGGN